MQRHQLSLYFERTCKVTVRAGILEFRAKGGCDVGRYRNTALSPMGVIGNSGWIFAGQKAEGFFDQQVFPEWPR